MDQTLVNIAIKLLVVLGKIKKTWTFEGFYKGHHTVFTALFTAGSTILPQRLPSETMTLLPVTEHFFNIS